MKRRCLLFFAAVCLAQGEPPLRILCTNGVAAAAKKLDFEKAAGMKIDIRYATSASIKADILGGASFDVAILTSDVIEDLSKQSKLKSDSLVPIAKSLLGMGVRKGAKHPDISTTVALKQTLLNTKSVTYARLGASRPLLNKMYEKLGIAAAMEPKIVLEAGSDEAVNRVATGKAEVILAVVSEIKPEPGLDLVGVLPRELETYVAFSSGINPASKNAAAGLKLLHFFAKQTAAFEAVGLERP